MTISSQPTFTTRALPRVGQNYGSSNQSQSATKQTNFRGNRLRKPVPIANADLDTGARSGDRLALRSE